jgi:MerR family mercuric resistance operon transcriptional regulator
MQDESMPAPNTKSRAGEATIGSASRRSGVNIETIRYYERVGLLASPRRTPGRRRIYDDELVAQLLFIGRSRELGFSIEDIRTLLGLADNRDRSCAEVRALTEQHAAAIRSKIADLARIEQVLADLATRCRGRSAPDCPILATLCDAARAE